MIPRRGGMRGAARRGHAPSRRRGAPQNLVSDRYETIRGCRVSDVIHLSKIRVVQEKRPKRRAYIADFEQPILFGVHAGVAAFYKVTPEEPLPSTLDYLVAAAAG